MKYLRNLHYTDNKPIVDAALLIALLPVFFLLKLPMQVYTILAIFAIVLKKRAFFWPLFALGLVSVILSFFETFTYAGLTRLTIFTGVILSLLLWAVSLQRLQNKLNIYMYYAPFMMLVLSLFYYTTISILFYTIVELFVFTTLLLWSIMRTSLYEALKKSLVIFFLSLPIIVLLFLFFPRISYKDATFGFKVNSYAVSSHDGQMWINEKAQLVPSKKVAMEVEFLEGEVKESDLYFRGSTLYINLGVHWAPIEQKKEKFIPRLNKRSRLVSYRITLYPHYKKFVYALDLPVKLPKKTLINRDYVISIEKNIVNSYKYDIESMLSYQDLTPAPKEATHFDQTKNPQTYAIAKKILNETKSDEEKIEKIKAFFLSLNLKYSLKPDIKDKANLSDSLLFGSKLGYCTHYAAAFATMARMTGVPSRIVTGFKGNGKNRIENYLVLKEEDAHAWVEVYLKKSGWTRIEPTAYTTLATQTQTTQNDPTKPTQTRQDKIKLYMMYLKYKIENWVLNYNYLKQRAFFTDLLDDLFFLLKFLGAIALLAIMGFTIFFLSRKETCRDQETCLVKKLLLFLEKKGIKKEPSESLHRFFLRHEKALPELKEVDKRYHKIHFSNNSSQSDQKELKESIDSLTKKR